MTTVYLIRHADVENPQRVLYGHLEGFGLSALGRRQAAAVGQSLRADPPGWILHSPLQRARETAEIIAANLGVPTQLVPNPALREAEFSRYLQGVPYWQIPARRPLWFVHKTKRGVLKCDESISVLGGRILDVMWQAVRDHPDATSALVSHADPLQAAWILLEGRPHTEREMYRKQVDRAGMLRVQVEAGRVASLRYVPPPRLPVAETSPPATAGAA